MLVFLCKPLFSINQLFPHLKARCKPCSQAEVCILNSRGKHQGTNFLYVRFSVGEAVIIYMYLFDLSDTKNMSLKIHFLHQAAFQVDRTLLN